MWEYRPVALRAPAVICALGGWSDAGEAASYAGSFLIDQFNAKCFAKVDSEEFFDYQSARPHIELVDGVVKDVQWPEVRIYEARLPAATRDLILIVGEEPTLRWRSFCQTVSELVDALGVQLVVSLGAFLADVAHTQQPPVTAAASDPTLIDVIRTYPPNYQGPSGLVGVLHGHLAATDTPTVSMWGAVPQYVAGAANPKVSLALIRYLEKVIGVNINAAKLESSAQEFERQVSLAVEADPQMNEFVKRLLDVAGEEQLDVSEDIPSGDALARDFQRFLRQRGGREEG